MSHYWSLHGTVSLFGNIYRSRYEQLVVNHAKSLSNRKLVVFLFKGFVTLSDDYYSGFPVGSLVGGKLYKAENDK